jgi:pimeloyl-ACP methyl ester carboxylesterase
MSRNAVLLAGWMLCGAQGCAHHGRTIEGLRDQFPDRFHGQLDSPLGAIHYESRGETGRPTVVLIHGVSGPMSVWDANVEALVTAGYRVIRYDLFGRGFSQRLDTEAYGLPLYLEQLEVLLAGLGVQEPISLVGSSFGAIVATEYGLHHPERVRGLVLVGPAGFPLEIAGMARLRDVPLLGSALTRLFGRKAILDQNRKYFADLKPPEPFWAWFQAQLDVPGTREAMLATLRNAPVQNYVRSYQELGRSRIPVGVIWGRQDVTFPYAHHETLIKAVPSARLVTVEGAAHLPQYERPEVANAALLDLLGSFREEAAPGE